MFVAQFFGIDLSIGDYLLIIMVSVLGSAATAGTTGATVMLTLTLSTLGLPLEGVGLLLAVDPIVDMGRTAVNVAGQALVPTLVSQQEGILDVERYHAERTEDLMAISPAEMDERLGTVGASTPDQAYDDGTRTSADTVGSATGEVRESAPESARR